MNKNKKQYGLLGFNIQYSLSPKLHKIIFEKLCIDGEYTLLDVAFKSHEESALNEVINMLKSGELSGINITIPYKEKIIKYVDKLDEIAQKIGAINTIKIENGSLVGYNTDYYGIVETLKEMNINLYNKECYIFGTGGSSKAVYYTLKELGGIPYFVSRGKTGEGVLSYDTIESFKTKMELAVNCTPKELDVKILSKFKNVFDLKYSKVADTVIDKSLDTNIIDGLFMLVVQGIKSQELWQNKKIGLYKEIYLELIKEIGKQEIK